MTVIIRQTHETIEFHPHRNIFQSHPTSPWLFPRNSTNSSWRLLDFQGPSRSRQKNWLMIDDWKIRRESFQAPKLGGENRLILKILGFFKSSTGLGSMLCCFSVMLYPPLPWCHFRGLPRRCHNTWCREILHGTSPCPHSFLIGSELFRPHGAEGALQIVYLKMTLWNVSMLCHTNSANILSARSFLSMRHGIFCCLISIQH